MPPGGGRATKAAVGTEDAAVPGLRPDQLTADRALPEKKAGIPPHLEPGWTCAQRTNHRDHHADPLLEGWSWYPAASGECHHTGHPELPIDPQAESASFRAELFALIFVLSAVYAAAFALLERRTLGGSSP